MVPPGAAPLLRVLARGRPASDPGCAGCTQLALFRALRRVGLEVQGGSGCDEAAAAPFVEAPGRWAAASGAPRSVAEARALLASARGAGARLVALADRDGAEARAAVDGLARAGEDVVVLDGADVAGVEAAVRAAAERGAVVVLLSPCVREAAFLRPAGAGAASPLGVDPSRCNRCGACLSVGCPALSDPGGEAVAVDPAICTGCGLCAPLCRSRALR